MFKQHVRHYSQDRTTSACLNTVIYCISGYFYTVCVAVRCAGPFWYGYRISLNLPLFLTVYSCLLSHRSIILWPALFEFYTVHYTRYCSHCQALSLARIDLNQSLSSHFSSVSLCLSLSLSLYNICVKCKRGTVPPCSEHHVHNVYFILLRRTQEESKWAVIFFL